MRLERAYAEAAADGQTSLMALTEQAAALKASFRNLARVFRNEQGSLCVVHAPPALPAP
jgi:hypothetical protein